MKNILLRKICPRKKNLSFLPGRAGPGPVRASRPFLGRACISRCNPVFVPRPKVHPGNYKKKTFRVWKCCNWCGILKKSRTKCGACGKFLVRKSHETATEEKSGFQSGGYAAGPEGRGSGNPRARAEKRNAMKKQTTF